jgi:hypothetical protein
MKITKLTLKRLIKEELKNLTKEGLYEQGEEPALPGVEDDPVYTPKPWDAAAAKKMSREWKMHKRTWTPRSCNAVTRLRFQARKLSVDARKDETLDPRKKEVIVAKLRALRKEMTAMMTQKGC